ncbi:hypothetical protein ATCC90586_010224 [Pythium insidiosum]|nr:hypothetical protein ATCC90586_010224 [Pythium insidiosum]
MRFRFANYSRNPINQSRQFDELYNKEENQSVRRIVLIAAFVLLLAYARCGLAAETSDEELPIHRRRECASFNRSYLADFADASIDGAALEALPLATRDDQGAALPAERNSLVQWSRLDRCDGAPSPSEPCLKQNVAIRDSRLVFNGSAGVRLETVQPPAVAQRLRVALELPLLADSAVHAATALSVRLRGSSGHDGDDDLTLSLSSHGALSLSSTSRNVSAAVVAGAPCALQPVAGSHRSVDVEVEWTDRGGLRAYWNDHLLLDHLAASRRASASMAPSLLQMQITHIVSSYNLSSSNDSDSHELPSPLRLVRVEVQAQRERAALECQPRIVPSASCRIRTVYTPRLGADQGYLSLAQLELYVRDVVPVQFPRGFTRVEEIGVSTENRTLLALCIGACDDKMAHLGTVPAVLFTGMHHSREPISMMNLIATIDVLATDVANGERETLALLFSRQLWFVLVVNPDGYARNEQLKIWKTGRAGQRKNRRPTQCTQDDDDGVDLNRNYDVCFAQDDVGSSTKPCQEDYRGPRPFSEPETLAIKQFVERHTTSSSNDTSTLSTDLATSLNYHSFGRYFNIPFACQARGTPNASSLALFTWMAKEMTTFNGFAYGQPWKDSNLYTVNGETSDWMWVKHGIFAMSPEVGPAFSTQPSGLGFWPPREHVPRLALELHYSNLVAARVAGPLFEIEIRRISIHRESSSAGVRTFVDVTWALQNEGLRSRDVESPVPQSTAETDTAFVLDGPTPSPPVPVWGAALSFSVLVVVIIVWRRRRWRLASSAATATRHTREQRHKYSRLAPNESAVDDRVHNPFAINSDSSEEDSEDEEAEYGRRRHRGRGAQNIGGEDV